MAKTYKVLVNDGKGSESNAVQVVQGAGDRGASVRMVAQRGVRYELQDVTKGKGFAPDQVRAKRVGNNLTLMFDGSQKPDVVVEDYYSPSIKGEGAVPVLAGLAENGGVYEYIPQDPNVNHLTPSLKDGNTPVLMALGGGALGEGFVLSALPLVAAAGGLSGWMIGAGLLGAAALAGGGGGGGGATPPTDTTAPGAVRVALPEADQGVNAAEAADGTPLAVTLPSDAVVGDTLTTVVTKPDGTKLSLVHVLTAADIAAKTLTQTIAAADLKDASGHYIDGTWTTSSTLTDAAHNVSAAAGSSFLLDTTAPTAASGHIKHDATNDTGVTSDDSITSNTKPVLVIAAESGAKVEVLLNGKTYLATETSTPGTYEVQITDALTSATYTPEVHVTDAAGNVNTSGVCVPFTVDALAPTAASGHIKHDAANDTGVQSDDNITNNTKPVLVLTAESGAKVEVLLNGKTYLATETSTQGTYEVQITDALSSATYTPEVHVTDAAGNVNTSGVCVPFTVDTSVANNVANGTDTDLNTGVNTKVEIKAVSEDTGTVTTDFITSAHQVKISGVVAQFLDTGMSVGDSVWVQIFNSTGALVGQEYVHPATTGTWVMTAPTASLPDGDYTVKAAIVDAAGNVLKTSADKTLTISQTYLVANVDTADAIEAGNNVAGTNPQGNVLANDADVNVRGTLVVQDIKFGTGVANPLVGGTTGASFVTVAGAYGDLTMSTDGSYIYNVDNTVRAQLLNVGETRTDTFTYTAKNIGGTLSVSTLSVVVHGTNDVASFASTDITTGSLTVGSIGSVNGSLTVNDPDAGQAKLLPPISSALDVTYGTFTLDYDTNQWSYRLKTNAVVSHGRESTDSLVVESWDSSASETITVTVLGSNASPSLDPSAISSVLSKDLNSSIPTANALPAGATKVSALLTGSSDVDSDSLGIAVTSVDSTHGHLWYTTDLGHTWREVTGAKANTAWLISPNDSTYVYYQQTSSGVGSAFSFVAWDQTTGQANNFADATHRGDATAFSIDGRAVVVNDTFDLTTQSAIDNAISNGTLQGRTGTDTIHLIGDGLILDLTNVETHMSGIETIDISGSGSNSIKLDLTSITQADFDAGVHKLYITGSAGDVVDLTNPDAGWLASEHVSTRTVDNVSYNVYQLDATDELLIHSTIATINSHA